MLGYLSILLPSAVEFIPFLALTVVAFYFWSRRSSFSSDRPGWRIFLRSHLTDFFVLLLILRSIFTPRDIVFYGGFFFILVKLLEPGVAAVVPWFYALARTLGRFARWGMLVALVLMSFILVGDFRGSYRQKVDLLRDYSNDPFFRLVGARPGLLLTCSDAPHITVLTRRPILLDGTCLDAITYFPEVAPEMNRILKEVYGVDLLVPPTKAHSGGLLPDDGRELWESRSAQQWIEIRKKYGVTDILTYAGWQLKLPIVTKNETYALYEISDRAVNGSGHRKARAERP
jgi:hypothetical protein